MSEYDYVRTWRIEIPCCLPQGASIDARERRSIMMYRGREDRVY
jgi:hypothetical protein